MFNDLLNTTKILVNSPKNINWDIAHYIVDNTFGKIMMLNLKEEKGYTSQQVEGFNFPLLVDTFSSQYPKISLNYEEIKNQHAQGRNPFQHHITTTYLSIRQEQADFYIELLEEFMDKSGILLHRTSKEQFLFDELRNLFQRLYRSKAKYSARFVRKIFNSNDLQDLFGISIREDDDDKRLELLEGEFSLIPNSATLTHNSEGRPNIILDKDSSQDQIEEKLDVLFYRSVDYVKQETGIDLSL